MFNGVLTKKEILEYLEIGKLKFNPGLDSFQVQTHSIDLRLGCSFRIPRKWLMNEKGREAIKVDFLADENRFEIIELEPGQFFEVLPGEAVIVSSLEQISMPNDLMAVIYPRSSATRRGLVVEHSGIVDAGYKGCLLIPIKNNTSEHIIRIYPGERFCQLSFYPLSQTVVPGKSRWHEKDISIYHLNEKKRIEEKLIMKGKIKELKKKFIVI